MRTYFNRFSNRIILISLAIIMMHDASSNISANFE
jgi:hypothetical protein